MMLASPLMYRGYVYSYLGDEISYYLGSRFYSPRMGRFLNADKYTDTGTGVLGTNMFSYCNNNPVMYVDPTGENSAVNTANQSQPLGIIEWFLAVYMAILTVLALPRSTVTSTSPLIESSKTKIPSKLKDGDKVKTPDTHPDEFEKIKGTDKYMHKKTKWEFKKDRLHNRDHWDARPRNGKTGDYHNINLDGTIL